MTKTLFSSPKYKTFVDDRNRALDVMNANAQLDMSRILHTALEAVSGFVSHMILMGNLDPYSAKKASEALNGFITHQFTLVDPKIIGRIQRLRKSAYLLTVTSEFEALARATKKTAQVDSFNFKTQMNAQIGMNSDHIVWPILLRLQGKIVQAFVSAVLAEKTGPEILQAVEKAYPPIQVYARPPRSLKPISAFKEADQDPKEKKEFDFYFDLTNDSDWDDAVQAYKDTELPPSRFDNAAQYNSDTGTMQYNWELEQDVTDNFVQSVRDGQVAAATELGVKDFVWVAVIDNKTCDVCCLPRAGKLTSEIETMLESGDLDKDECDAVVPPAHPNCRCDIAPVANGDPVEGPDWKSFDDWLNT